MARYPAPSAAEGWHFLTAGADGTAALQAAVGFHSRFDAAAAQFLHPSGLVFLTPDGVVSGYLLGVGYQPADLEHGVQLAAAGAIGPTASAVLLLCFHYARSPGATPSRSLKFCGSRRRWSSCPSARRSWWRTGGIARRSRRAYSTTIIDAVALHDAVGRCRSDKGLWYVGNN